MREGTKERCNGSQIKWCSPSHWVPKDKEGTWFSLVTAMRHLNSMVELQTSTFPTASKVMQAIRPNSKVYLASNLMAGYHQVTIRPEDRGLFSVLLSDRCYRYMHAPMSYYNSGHRFVLEVMRLVQDLNLVMEVDDTLM